MKIHSFRHLQASFAAGLLLASTTLLLQAREGEGGDDHGGGGGGNEAEFLGRVQTLPAGGPVAGSWQVNGVTLLVDAGTAIDQNNGRIAVGSLVEVHAARAADGSLHATRIQDEDTRHEDFGEAEFVGTVTALPNTAGFIGTWTVGGRAVTVTTATVLRAGHGAVAVGSTVEVAGRVLSDGSVGAMSIHTEGVENEHAVQDRHFTGVIEALPAGSTIGVWKVSGLTINVTAATKIEAEGGVPAVGATVRIEGVQAADASIAASEINLVRGAFGDDSPETHLVGEVEHLPGSKSRVGNWTVDGVTVTVGPECGFNLTSGDKPKKAHEGREVEIHGRRQSDGSILATSAVLVRTGQETHRHLLKYDGLVASVLPATSTRPGTIILVGGQTLRFDDRTQFATGAPAIGDTVSIKASSGDDGTDDARKVKVK